MNIKKHIVNTLTFYLDLLDIVKNTQNRQYITIILFDLCLLDKNMIDFLLKHTSFFYEIKYKCNQFLNDPYALPFFKEKLKLYNNTISEIELKLLNNNR
jgi:hypothetical protein